MIAIVISFALIKNIKRKFENRKLFIIIIIFTLGLIYFAGEEISWGQHWFQWNANEFFKTYNDQYINGISETNFHNISSWFDQKPRILLIFFVLFGGIFCPLYFSDKKYSKSIKSHLIPTIYCFPTSLMCLFFYLLDNSYKILCYGIPGVDITCKFIPELFHLRTSEIIEFYIAYFLFIYILSIYLRLKKI